MNIIEGIPCKSELIDLYLLGIKLSIPVFLGIVVLWVYAKLRTWDKLKRFLIVYYSVILDLFRFQFAIVIKRVFDEVIPLGIDYMCDEIAIYCEFVRRKKFAVICTGVAWMIYLYTNSNKSLEVSLLINCFSVHF